MSHRALDPLSSFPLLSHLFSRFGMFKKQCSCHFSWNKHAWLSVAGARLVSRSPVRPGLCPGVGPWGVHSPFSYFHTLGKIVCCPRESTHILLLDLGCFLTSLGPTVPVYRVTATVPTPQGCWKFQGDSMQHTQWTEGGCTAPLMFLPSFFYPHLCQHEMTLRTLEISALGWSLWQG